MTKLMEWLSGVGLLLAAWFYLITNKEHSNFARENYQLILYSPIIVVLIFGLYAATIILYRVYTFNDCEEAATDLQGEIKEAKEKLIELGFKWKEKAN